MDLVHFGWFCQTELYGPLFFMFLELQFLAYWEKGEIDKYEILCNLCAEMSRPNDDQFTNSPNTTISRVAQCPERI